jgi:hypothetical protein
MKNKFRMPSWRGHMVRWGVGITLAGFLAGGAFALAATAGNAGTTASTSSQVSNQASSAQLNALLSASGTSAGSATNASKNSGVPRRGPVQRLRRLGGMYGSFTFRTAKGNSTLAFERGTIQSVTGSDIVVRAADGTTMTWLIVSDTVVRDHGKSSTSSLSDGQLIFVGGPVVSGARDARLVVVRTAGSGTAPSTPAPRSSASTSTSVS